MEDYWNGDSLVREMVNVVTFIFDNFLLDSEKNCVKRAAGRKHGGLFSGHSAGDFSVLENPKVRDAVHEGLYIIFYNGVKDVKAICEEPVSRCPPLRRQRCPRTPLGGRLRSPSGLSTLKPIKSFWTAPGGQARPPLLTPLTVWSVCWSSPGDSYKRKRVSCVEGGGSGSTLHNSELGELLDLKNKRLNY
ncbi:hypothetical protein CEXT_405811 [Caerostris extrusa]|uniref:Uncharacterized protein n=1 Tax=Caerostris extrusa TaxID=172846 RepID=A0AAV4UNL5_CAEEX|nr:hypothetical protein CEXT_405811 [Caerostris extrusa]